MDEGQSSQVFVLWSINPGACVTGWTQLNWACAGGEVYINNIVSTVIILVDGVGPCDHVTIQYGEFLYYGSLINGAFI